MRRKKVKPIRLLIVDDHKIVRIGLATLFRHYPRIQVVGEAATAAAAVKEAVRLKPDVVLMDVRLSDGSGVEACRELRAVCPHTHVLFLTSYADEEAMLATISAGAAGFLLKQADEEPLIHAVETVAKGQSILDPAMIQPLLARVRSLSAQIEMNQPSVLSPQEERIMNLVVEGKTNKEIAHLMDLSTKTVKNYLGNIFQKLQVSRRSQAAALFAKRFLPDRSWSNVGA